MRIASGSCNRGSRRSRSARDSPCQSGITMYGTGAESLISWVAVVWAGSVGAAAEQGRSVGVGRVRLRHAAEGVGLEHRPEPDGEIIAVGGKAFKILGGTKLGLAAAAAVELARNQVEHQDAVSGEAGVAQ